MLSADPETTQLPGSLIAARSTPSVRYSATSSGLSGTATITPGGAACIRRARTDTTFTAVGRSKTPANVAAAYSPMLCARHRRRANAIRLGELGQRVLDGEQGGLSAVGALQLRRRPAEDLVTQVDAELGGKALRALVEVLGEHRLRLVQSLGHPDVLGTLAGEQENDPVRA